jgi:cytochrome P450
MSEVTPNYGKVPVPSHVPAELVVDFDYFRPPGMAEGDVYTAWKKLHDGPDIVWTPCNGGHWIVTRAEDIKYIQENYKCFSHEVFTIPRGATKIVMPPLTVDPPEHAKYRAVLNPFFRGSKVKEMEDKVRALTIELIEGLKPRGACEFMDDFARIMPVTIFMGIAGMPLERRAEFSNWAASFIKANDQATRDKYLGLVGKYISDAIAERAKNPGDDLLSAIVNWRNNPRYQGEHEVMGMAFLVFFGGLDTVANMLGFAIRHLAAHPEQQKRLRAEPEIAAQVAEEFIRRQGLSNTGRLVTEDTPYKNIVFKKDEMVMVPISLSSMDDRKYKCPMDIDFDREFESMDTFGNGPHRCVGAPLARAEMRIFLEEWCTRMPVCRLDPAHPALTISGSVNGVEHLHLLWDVPETD